MSGELIQNYKVLVSKPQSVIHFMRTFGYDITTVIAVVINNSIVAMTKL